MGRPSQPRQCRSPGPRARNLADPPGRLRRLHLPADARHHRRGGHHPHRLPRPPTFLGTGVGAIKVPGWIAPGHYVGTEAASCYSSEPSPCDSPAVSASCPEPLPTVILRGLALSAFGNVTRNIPCSKRASARSPSTGNGNVSDRRTSPLQSSCTYQVAPLVSALSATLAILPLIVIVFSWIVRSRSSDRIPGIAARITT